MMRHTALSVWLRCLVLSAPSLLVSAYAPSAFGQDKQELSRARALFQRAIELEQAGNYTAALEQFRDVGQVRMTPQVRFHIASCEEKLGRLVTALGGYELALADADSVGQEFRDEVDAVVIRLREGIPKLVILRGTGAEAAEIELDGVTLGASSIGVPVPLDPGPHAITAKAPSMQSFSQTVTISQNEQKRLNIELTPAPTPIEPVRTISATVEPRPPSRVVPYVIGGAGGASLIAAGALFGLRQSALSDLESKCGSDRKNCPPSARAEVRNLNLYNVASQVALGIGVAGVGAAVTLLLLQTKSSPPTTGLVFTPSAPNAFAGASLSQRF